MTTNKRKRECEVGEEEEEKQVNGEVAGSPLKPPQLKKPHNSPSEIVLSAIEKIAQLERYMNEQRADEDTDSDYSDLSDVESECGRFDSTSSNDNAEVLPTNGDSPVVIRETAKFNPEILGFAICAQETMNFLRKEGFPEDDPLIVNMKNRLLSQLSDYHALTK